MSLPVPNPPPITYGFHYHGNYGGPNYTGSKFGGKDFSPKPVDLLDASFRKHDAYYHHGLEKTGDREHVKDVLTNWDKFTPLEKLKGGLSGLGFAAKSLISSDNFRDGSTIGDKDLEQSILAKYHSDRKRPSPTNKTTHALNGNLSHKQYMNSTAFAPRDPIYQSIFDDYHDAKRSTSRKTLRPSPDNKSMHSYNGNPKGQRPKGIGPVANPKGYTNMLARASNLGAPAREKKKQHPKDSGYTVPAGVYPNPVNKNKEGKQTHSCTEPCHDRLGAIELSNAQHVNGQIVAVFPCNLVNFGNRTQNLASMYSMWMSKLRFDIEIAAPTSLGGEYCAFFDPDPEHSYVTSTTSVENTQRAYQMQGRKIFNPSKARKVTVSHPGHPRSTRGLGPDGWLYTHAEDSDERITEYGTFVIVCTSTTTTFTGGVFTIANNSNISFKNPDFNTTTLSDSLCASYFATPAFGTIDWDLLQFALLPINAASSNYTGTEVTPYVTNSATTPPSGLVSADNFLALRPGLWQVDFDLQTFTTAAGHTFAWAWTTPSTVLNSTIAINPIRVGNAFGITATGYGVRASAVISITDTSGVVSYAWTPKVLDGNNVRLAGVPLEYRPSPVQAGSFSFKCTSHNVTDITLASLSVRRLPPVLVPNPKFGVRIQANQDRLDKLEAFIKILQSERIRRLSEASEPIYIESDSDEKHDTGSGEISQSTVSLLTAALAKLKN